MVSATQDHTAALSVRAHANYVHWPKKKDLPLHSLGAARRTFQTLPLQTCAQVSFLRIMSHMLIRKPTTGKGNGTSVIYLNHQDSTLAAGEETSLS